MAANKDVNNRLERVLNALLDPQMPDINGDYFEKLMRYLQAKENEWVLHESFATDWVDKCVTILEEGFSKLQPKVIPFMLNFAATLILNECNFVKFKARLIATRIFAFVERNGTHFNHAVKLGCIRMIHSLTYYSLGLEFLRQNCTWKLLLKYATKDSTLYVVRESSRAFYALLYKYSVKIKNNEFVLEMLQAIMEPLQANLCEPKGDGSCVMVDDIELLQSISPNLDLLTLILEQTLEAEERCNISELLKTQYNFEDKIWRLLKTTHSPYFVQKILNAQIAYNFANMTYEKLYTALDETSDYNEFGLQFYNSIRLCTTRSDIFTFIKVLERNHKLWHKLGSRKPKEIKIQDDAVIFENELIILHIAPITFSLNQASTVRREKCHPYISELMNISAEHTVRTNYTFRDSVFKPDGKLGSNFTVDLGHKCIQSIISIENILTHNQTVLVCQTLLKAIVMISEDLAETADDLIIESPRVMQAILVGLRLMIGKHTILWPELVDVMTVLNSIISLLLNSHFNDEQCKIEAIKLVQVLIERFLSPNMSLLIHNLNGSGLVLLGPVIRTCLHHIAWQIRDSILELTTCIAEISHLKYTPFQDFLADNMVATIICDIAKHDSEMYVRASALKCITNMIPIHVLWENELSKRDLWDCLLHVIYISDEDTERQAALCALHSLFVSRKMPPEYEHIFYSTLCYCVVGDQHWEIKVKALEVWHSAFDRCFERRGMISGKFPAAIFSPERNRIEFLDSNERLRRTAKVFVEVQKLGYFGVQLKCLEEESSEPVLDMAIKRVQLMYQKIEPSKLEDIFHIIDELAVSSTPPKQETTLQTLDSQAQPSTTDLLSKPSETPSVDAMCVDEVIDSILEAKDIKLIEDNYIKTSETNNGTSDPKSEPDRRHIEENFYKNYALHVRDYTGALKKYNIDNFVEKQRQSCSYKDTFLSLLDDMLYLLECKNEQMFADCY